MKRLSDDWTGGLHRRLGGREDATRLALVLGPVQSVVRVVDPRVPPMRVEWAAVGQADDGPMSQSYTDFRGGVMRINPLPVLENRMDPRDQVDVSIGQAVHEASHSKHLRDLWFSTLLRVEDGKEVPAFEPLRVAAWLLNVASDVHDEALTLAAWPGFAEYIDAMLDWLWVESNRRHDRLTPLQARMRIAFMGARFFDRASAHASAEDAAEMAWWREWLDDYLAGRHGPSETVQRGLDRLREDPQAAREMDEQAEKERVEREAGENLRRQLERLAREGVQGVESCASHWAEMSQLDAETAEEVRRMVSEGLVEVAPLIVAKGANAPPMRVRKPLEDAASRRAFIGKPSPLVEQMRAALVFRQERPRHDLKLQRSGTLDDEELWRFAAGDDRLFSEHVVEDSPDTALGMLVDISGSMNGGGKLATAQRLAQILLAAAMDREGVEPRVWAHSGDTDLDGSDVYTIWEPGDPVSRLGLIASLAHGNNYDGFSIAYCVDRLRQSDKPQKVLLVLSDGYPSGDMYGGAEAEAHVRQVCRWAEGQGVSVVQIAIDPSLRAEDQAAMFGEGNYVLYRSDRQLPRDLTRVLERYVR